MVKIKVFFTQLLMDVSYYVETHREKSCLFRLLSVLVFLTNKWLFGMSSFRAISHSDFCRIQGEDVTIIKKNRMGFSSNVIFNDSQEQQQLIPLPMNDLQICHHHKVFIQGGSGLVLDMKHKLAINNYCAELDSNMSYQDIVTKTTKGKFLLLKLGRKNTYKKLPSGIMINDRYAKNYFHGLFEILIRLLVIRNDNKHIPTDVPIIIDDSILKIASLKRVFDILMKNLGRDFYVLKENERLLIDSLWCITPINVFCHRRERKYGNPSYYIYDKDLMSELRDTLLPFKSERIFPKRVFITRKNSSHRMFNEEEVFSVLEPMGFQKISPELLSFEEQISLFNNAEWIVSGAGAALTNLLFVSSGCSLVCVYDNYKGFVPPVFTTPAYFNGCKVWYFKSNSSDEATALHADFSVNIQQFAVFINSKIN